jgi:3-oxoacyl-[acyl-carrier protein] reductase
MQGSTEARRALVTGAAGTLGIAVAKTLLARGIPVALVDVNKPRLEEAAAGLGPGAFPYAFDLSDADAVQEGWDRLAADFGEVDILVNNAGILTTDKLEATSPEQWRRIMDVNLNGVFYLTRLVVPGMKRRRWGRIINVSSLAAKTGGITAGTAYSTSKGALIALTFTLAAELASHGITVNGIAPAYVRTPMVTEQLTEEQRAAVLAKIPVGRYCEPEEFAHVVAFLVDELAGFITGEIIDQNGGLHFD